MKPFRTKRACYPWMTHSLVFGVFYVFGRNNGTFAITLRLCSVRSLPMFYIPHFSI